MVCGRTRKNGVWGSAVILRSREKGSFFAV